MRACPAISLQFLGRFTLLFAFLKSQSDTVVHLALQVIYLACQQNECIVDMGTAQVLNYLFCAIRSCKTLVSLCLDILYSLLSHTPIVKEALVKGGVAFVLDIFCNDGDMKLRVRSAEVVARMMADRLVGGKVRIQMMKFLPALFGDAMRDTPSIAVQLLESTSETPELIWTDDMKTRLSTVLSRITERQLSVITSSAQAEWSGIDPGDESELPNLDSEANIGGIYIRLLVANPGWILRKPKETLGDLLEAALQGLQKEAEPDKTKLIVSSICGLLHSQPVLLEHIPALGPLPRMLRLLSQCSNPSAVCGLLNLLNPISNSCTCVDALSRLECIQPVAVAIRNHPEHVHTGLEYLERLLNSPNGTEEFVQQSVNCDLVPQLLKLLEESSHAHLTPSGRALVVSILKAMSSSRVHGQRVALLLDKCPSWASYRDQRHDLFLQASGSALPALPAGVAGYITHHRTPNLPKQLSPPTDPLQSMP